MTIFGFAHVNATQIAAIVVALPLLVTQGIGGGATMFGVIIAATGVGEAVGAVVVSQAQVRRTGHRDVSLRGRRSRLGLAGFPRIS